jgi:SPP1 family predicted phage head-tail adaptor
MLSIGGDVQAVLQAKQETGKTPIGTRGNVWADVLTLTGYLDLLTGQGDSSRAQQNAKLKDSSHVFVTDYQEVPYRESEARLLIGDQLYRIQAVDDPMGLHDHLEIYLTSLEGDTQAWA